MPPRKNHACRHAPNNTQSNAKQSGVAQDKKAQQKE
jgi:hypothetical protein